VNLTKNDLISIRAISQQLRVPELSYRVSHPEEIADEIQVFFSGFRDVSDSNRNNSALKYLTTTLAKPSLPVNLNNLAFISDRFFDVWGRKNRLYDDINTILKTWRHPFFKMMYQSPDLKLLVKFVEFIDVITNDNLAWMSRPERSKKVVLDELSNIGDLLFESTCINDAFIDSLISQWQVFFTKQTSKSQKVIQRLTLSESQLSWGLYCDTQAKSFQNTLFLDQPVACSLQDFLSNYWVKVISENIEKETGPHIPDEIKKLTAKLKAVFCTKGSAALRWVENLVDDLQIESSKIDIQIPDEAWRCLEADLVEILQGSPVSESSYIPLNMNDSQLKYVDAQLHNSIEVSKWFYSTDDSFENRQQVVAIFPENQEVLFCNYLGIKTNRYTFKDLSKEIQSGLLKPLQVEASFLEVIQKTSLGLLKVATTQKKARVIAAEKAKKEAEILLAEKERAEKAAMIKAEEIADRTKKMLQKRLDKQRADQESVAFNQISKCKLGAWISVVKKGDAQSSESKRYKLVVKLAATDKFIFVDKLGIKKIEYTESMLMQGIINNEIEIISDGAEFEQSLERVVSRLRVSK